MEVYDCQQDGEKYLVQSVLNFYNEYDERLIDQFREITSRPT